MSSIPVCPLNGRLTKEIHYDSIANAFKAGLKAASDRAENPLTDEILAEILEAENLWLHDPRAENGLKEAPLKRTGSRGRPKSSGSGGNGDPASKSRGGNNVEYANKAYDSACCARRHWNGGICSDDGTQAGAQCTNEPSEGGEFCAKCQARYESSLDGKCDWHGSFAKTIQEDPGAKKDGGAHPWKIPKSKDEDDELKAEKEKAKKEKKAEEEVEDQRDMAEVNRLIEEDSKKDNADLVISDGEETEEMDEAPQEQQPEPVEQQPEPVEEQPEPVEQQKPDNLEEDGSEIIEVEGPDGKVGQFILDKESDTIYTKDSIPIGNWVDGKASWDAEETGDASDESDEDSDSDSDSDEDSDEDSDA